MHFIHNGAKFRVVWRCNQFHELIIHGISGKKYITNNFPLLNITMPVGANMEN